MVRFYDYLPLYTYMYNTSIFSLQCFDSDCLNQVYEKKKKQMYDYRAKHERKK